MDPDRPPGIGRTTDGRRWGWWFAQLMLTGVAGFFVCFGVAVLGAAYNLADPFSFVMTFFAANLIILISLVMVLAFVLRMWRAARVGRPLDEPDEDPSEKNDDGDAFRT